MYEMSRVFVVVVVYTMTCPLNISSPDTTQNIFFLTAVYRSMYSSYPSRAAKCFD